MRSVPPNMRRQVIQKILEDKTTGRKGTWENKLKIITERPPKTIQSNTFVVWLGNGGSERAVQVRGAAS